MKAATVIPAQSDLHVAGHHQDDSAAQLEDAKQELKQFSYSVSHDLRAPLRHIISYVEILQTAKGRKIDKASRQHLKAIALSAAQMWQMIEALLEYSRIGHVEMHVAWVNLAAVVTEVQRGFQSKSKGRKIDWRIGDLPKVRGDPSLLHLAMVHLLSNAVKFTRLRPRARIEIGATSRGQETICFVRDNGVGFDMNGADKLFGVFQRFHQASAFEGAGVGLASVRRIIQRHGGRMWAEARVDGGTTFYFSIPVTPETAT